MRLTFVVSALLLIPTLAFAQQPCRLDPTLCETRLQREEALNELADVAARLSYDEQQMVTLKAWWQKYIMGLAHCGRK